MPYERGQKISKLAIKAQIKQSKNGGTIRGFRYLQVNDTTAQHVMEIYQILKSPNRLILELKKR